MNQQSHTSSARNPHATGLLFASLAEPAIVEKAVAVLVRQLRPACARLGTVALTAMEFDFENASARCEFLLYHTGHSCGEPGKVCDRLNTGAALRRLETALPRGSRVLFRRLRFEPAESSSRGLLLRGYALLDLSESAFTAADCGEEPRQLPDFASLEHAMHRHLPVRNRPRLASARVEPDSEVSFLFSTPSRPAPVASARPAGERQRLTPPPVPAR